MSKTVIIEGTIEWAKLFEDDRDLGGQDNDAARAVAKAGGRYNCVFYPDDMAEFEDILDTRKVPRKSMGHDLIKSKDGKQYFRPYRNHNPKITGKGVEIVGSGGPPVVMDNDGNLWDPEVAIGNGSSVKIALDVYPTSGNNCAFRLKGVRVIELVEFSMEEEDVADALMA